MALHPAPSNVHPLQVTRNLDKKVSGLQNLLDSCLLNAYIKIVLRATLVNAQPVHSSLEPHGLDLLVEEAGAHDPVSGFQGLITTYNRWS
ncbi:hypothetical protein N7465_008328 [Penicillium sp. CMV-2018d]|nr:hypothetical protein N7465_008328 [Penicillium sp. CMV-2018d]